MPERRVIFDNKFCRLEGVQLPGQNFETIVFCTPDSVSGLLYDRTHRRVLLVRQNREPAKTVGNPEGTMVELVAGRFDVALGPKALLVKEAKEEAGVSLTEDQVELLNDGMPMTVNCGTNTERNYLAFAEIECDDAGDDETVYGVVSEGERITRVWVPVEAFLQWGKFGKHQCNRTLTMALYLENRLLRARVEG